MLSDEALQHGQVGGPLDHHVYRFFVEVDAAGNREVCVFRCLVDQVHRVGYSDRTPFEGDVERAGVLQRIVEQPQCQTANLHVDLELVEFVQLAHNMNGAVDDSSGEWRESRAERADVGVERRVVHRERYVRVPSRGELDRAPTPRRRDAGRQPRPRSSSRRRSQPDSERSPARCLRQPRRSRGLCPSPRSEASRMSRCHWR